MADDLKANLLRRFLADRSLAHKTLFAHRHKDTTPEFHKEIIDVWTNSSRYALVVAFRGAAKSTLAEEHMILGSCFGEFKYGVIVGNSYPRACERLSAIKHELANNEVLIALFGDMVGPTWAESEIVLSNGVKIQAFGARQSLRGAKHNDSRPDFVLVDDIEDEELVATEEARRKLMRWIVSSLIPAMDPHGKLRMIGTPLHPKGAVEIFKKDPQWHAKTFPIRHRDETTGEMKATWPDRFSMEWINDHEKAYANAGNSVEFAQEYLCVAEDAATKPFQTRHIPTQTTCPPFANTPTWIFVDPARTVNAKTSARTGYAAWTWLGNRLLVRKAYGEFHQPDQIISELFKLDEKFSPVSIGIELDGLEEFLNQPLRAAMVERGRTLPIRGMRAPKGKDQFIMGLQPFFQAGDVMFEEAMPDLVAELLQFPTGRKDVPNALAYALRMRAGRPVYEDFSQHHINGDIGIVRSSPRYLLLSARGSRVAGCLVQFIGNRLRVLGDWVREGPPSDCLEELVHEAIMKAEGAVKLAAPAEQFDKYNGFGLPAAARQINLSVERLGSAATCQGSLSQWLRRQIRGEQAIMVHPDARWTVNGFFGGYARAISNSGELAGTPTDDAYKLVMEPLEAFMSWFNLGSLTNQDDDGRVFATSGDGRQYLTSMSRKRG